MGTNTGIGIGIGIPFKNNVLGEGKPYLPPEIKDSLKAVVIAYGKTNNDSDRAIVKNLVDASNPFVISNAAFKLNSGFGKYETELSNTRIWTQSKETTSSPFSSNYNGLSGWIVFANTELTNSADMPSFKIQVKGLLEGQELIYRYYDSNGQSNVYSMGKDGEYTLPADIRTAKPQTSNTSGFQVVKNDTNTITITQIPSFEGAFVTDGIDDLIKSTKSATEMLDGSNEVTVVSMIHQIKTNDDTTRNNWFFTPVSYLENRVVKDKIGKTGIYGYTSTNVTNAQISDITPILGDKNDYTLYSKIEDGDRDYFSVEGVQNEGIWYTSSVAWYWTIIANKVLTTDQINQVIAYFNLDRTLKPDILCNTIKQGITNDNHAEFGDKLIDFSGNGRDIQLNNIAWKGDSGIGKYEVDFLDWVINSPFINERTSFTFSSSNDTNNDIITIYQRVPAATQSFKIKAKLRGRVLYRYYVNNGDTISISYYEVKEGINILPDSADPTSVNGKVGFVLKGLSSVKVEQVPFHAGALCLDGVNDFGKVTGMPIYKDYTFIIDYERISYTSPEVWTASVASKAHTVGQGAFILMLANREVELSRQSNSFGSTTTFNRDDFTRTLLYQSKYKCGDVNLTVGEGIDGDTLWLGTLRDNDYRFFNGAIYSLMSFPYSMSEFLIERQLKKHKLGTLYPNMVEFRPIIKANANYNIFYTAMLPLTGNIWERINIGDYIPVGRRVAIQLSFDNEASELVSAISSQLGNISITKNSNNKGYTIFGDILKNKSPQKINITIDEYIRYEDIVQPYPVLLRFNDENGNEVSWGGKFRVGSTITRIGSAADSNLLPNIYNIFGLLLNDNQVTSSKVIVEKTMVFKAKSAYIFDNNEPKCILSPRLLRIPNSSYKILGRIPDISGHGNHGVIHNSAYEGMSGANSYPVVFGIGKTWGQMPTFNSIYTVDSNKWHITKILYANSGLMFSWIKQNNQLVTVRKVPSFKIKVSGLEGNSKLTYSYIGTEDAVYRSSLELDNGTHELPESLIPTNSMVNNSWIGFTVTPISEGVTEFDCDITIEVLPDYEGAYCLDGVDDFITIPTTVGGKQVLMKVNSRKSDCYLYDQRNNWTQYLGIVSTKDFIAYNYSNQRGKTYIDGILNENITANDLISITHNITVTNNRDDVEQYSPCIGTSFARNSYAQMALYDFMLFDGISTDDKIKELNEYVGIEGNTE